MLIVYGYSKCSTLKKTIKYIESQNIKYQHVDNVINKLSAEQLKDLFEKSNQQDVKRIFNTSGIRYRELDLKNKLALMSQDEAFELLATDGMLVKRPLITNGVSLVIGYNEEEITKL